MNCTVIPSRDCDRASQLAAHLDRARRWHIEYGGFLSNHLAHNHVVFAAAGADERLHAWWEDLYAGCLDQGPARASGDLIPRPAPDPATRIDAGNWLRHVERERRNFAAFVPFFEGRIAELGRAETVRRFLPPLLPGLAGAALHPLIHTGWAWEAGHDGTLADGLAYLATAHQPLATGAVHRPSAPLWAPGASGVIDASLAFLSRARADGLAEIANEAAVSPAYVALERGAFQPRVIAFDDPDLPLAAALNAAGPLGLPAGGRPLEPAIEEAAVLVAAALRASDNEFFVLHGLTAFHALWNLLPTLEAADRRDALTHWWRAAMAVLVAQRFPGLDDTVARLAAWRDERSAEADAPHPPDTAERAWWLALLRSTLGSHDEHVPKAVHALRRQAESGAFSTAAVRVFAEAAAHIARPHPSGELHQNLT